LHPADLGPFQELTVEIFVLWPSLSVVAGVVAAAKGRSGLGYFLLSIFLTPLVGLILAIALPKRDTTVHYPGPGDIAAGARVPCPQCAEQIVATAKLCRFCGYQLAAPQEAAPEAPATAVTPGPGAYKAGRALGGLFSSEKHATRPTISTLDEMS
jgi:hypothetical protein